MNDTGYFCIIGHPQQEKAVPACVAREPQAAGLAPLRPLRVARRLGVRVRLIRQFAPSAWRPSRATTTPDAELRSAIASPRACSYGTRGGQPARCRRWFAWLLSCSCVLLPGARCTIRDAASSTVDDHPACGHLDRVTSWSDLSERATAGYPSASPSHAHQAWPARPSAPVDTAPPRSNPTCRSFNRQ